jgi:hypothetical protein
MRRVPVDYFARIHGAHRWKSGMPALSMTQCCWLSMSLSTDEIARTLSVSADTVLREWKLAGLWLLREMGTKEAAG